MENSTNLLLPYIMPSQAQKHVTHNEALDMLDALVLLTVADRTTTAPPADPADGARYIVGPSAGGAWAGREGQVAAWQDGVWSYFAPQEGWIAWCAAEGKLLVFSGGTWEETGARAGGLQNVPQIGVNTTADATNRLAVSSHGSLLSHAGGSHRLAVNKNSAADTASIIFQDGFSGRAELGLAGDDRLSFRVSADGSTFVEAIGIESDGKATFPAVNLLTDHAINLYADSGRLAGDGATDITIGAFAFPDYLTLYNGSAATGLGKFIHNNDDYGGTAGTLAPEVKDLIDRIRDPGYRRYGLEFWIAEVTMGSGTGGALAYEGTTYHLGGFSRQQVRAPAHTFHAYLRAVDDDVLVRVNNGATVSKDGQVTDYPDNAVITPAEGWVSITIHDSQDPRTSYGYNPSIFYLYAQNAGDRWLIACPALMGGLTKVDDDIGVIAGNNSWPG